MSGGASRTNIFKRFWHLTGGGFLSGFLIALALTCLLLFIAIEVSPDTGTADSDAQTPTSETAQTQEGSESEEDVWVQGLEEGDTTTIGNRINTSQLPDSSFIYEVSIEELASADSYLDGQTVQVTGEVVGDRITSESDPKYCWITLQSQDPDDSEVTVYMSKTASKVIDTYGSYNREGTTLQVRGTFYLASEDHQGVSEIHAESVSAVSPGEIIPDSGNPKRMETGLILIFFGSVLMLLFNILRERQR